MWNPKKGERVEIFKNSQLPEHFSKYDGKTGVIESVYKDESAKVKMDDGGNVIEVMFSCLINCASPHYDNWKKPSNKPAYPLDFYQAMKELFENGKWIKGENFAPYHYMKLDSNGFVVMVSVNDFGIETHLTFNKAIAFQKFRIVEIATMKALEN